MLFCNKSMSTKLPKYKLEGVRIQFSGSILTLYSNDPSLNPTGACYVPKYKYFKLLQNVRFRRSTID